MPQWHNILLPQGHSDADGGAHRTHPNAQIFSVIPQDIMSHLQREESRRNHTMLQQLQNQLPTKWRLPTRGEIHEGLAGWSVMEFASDSERSLACDLITKLNHYFNFSALRFKGTSGHVEKARICVRTDEVASMLNLPPLTVPGAADFSIRMN